MKYFEICPYCKESFGSSRTINLEHFEKLKWKFSDHLKNHQDEGEAPKKGRDGKTPIM